MEASGGVGLERDDTAGVGGGRGDGDGAIEMDREGEDVAGVVVEVLADEVDAARGAGEEGGGSVEEGAEGGGRTVGGGHGGGYRMREDRAGRGVGWDQSQPFPFRSGWVCCPLPIWRCYARSRCRAQPPFRE